MASVIVDEASIQANPSHIAVETGVNTQISKKNGKGNTNTNSKKKKTKLGNKKPLRFLGKHWRFLIAPIIIMAFLAKMEKLILLRQG